MVARVRALNGTLGLSEVFVGNGWYKVEIKEKDPSGKEVSGPLTFKANRMRAVMFLDSRVQEVLTRAEYDGEIK